VDASDEEVKAAALASESVQKFLDGKTPKKVIVVPRKLVSIVI
jgi:leucyl-tRNA synthetase